MGKKLLRMFWGLCFLQREKMDRVLQRHVRTIREVRTVVTRLITDVYYKDGAEVERSVVEVRCRQAPPSPWIGFCPPLPSWAPLTAVLWTLQAEFDCLGLISVVCEGSDAGPFIWAPLQGTSSNIVPRFTCLPLVERTKM